MMNDGENTVDLLSAKYQGMQIYELVEILLGIGQTERVVAMAMENGNIAIYNTSEGKFFYIGYINITDSTFVTKEKDE